MRFSSTLVTLLLAAASYTAAATDERRMLPITARSTRLQPRHLRQEFLRPADAVTVSYAEDASSTSQSLYLGHLKLKALPHFGLLLLEEFDVACSEGSMKVTGLTKEELDVARKGYGSGKGLLAIVDAPSCVDDEMRRLFLINDAQFIDGPSESNELHLSVSPIEWEDALQGISLDLRHAERGGFDKSFLVRRQSNDDDDSPDDGLHGNSDISFNAGNETDRVQIYPFKLPLQQREVTTDLKVHCVGCRSRGKAKVEAALDIDSDVFRSRKRQELSRVDQAFIAVNITEDLVAYANFEIFAAATARAEVPVTIATFPLTPFNFGIINVGPELDLKVIGGVEIGGSVNFTVGGKVTIPKGAFAKLDFTGEAKDGKKSAKGGWDQAKFEKVPLRLDDLGEEITMQVDVSLVTSLTFGVRTPGDAVRAEAGLELEIPKLSTKGTLVKNVTNSCTAVSAKDYEYHPYALNITSGLDIVLSALAVADADPTSDPSRGGSSSSSDKDKKDKKEQEGDEDDDSSIFAQEWRFELYKMSRDVGPRACLAFDKSKLGVIREASQVPMLVDKEKVKKAVADNGGKAPGGLSDEVLEKAGEEKSASGAERVGCASVMALTFAMMLATVLF